VSSSLHLIIFTYHLCLRIIDWCCSDTGAAFVPNDSLSFRTSILENLRRLYRSEKGTAIVLWCNREGECRGTRVEGREEWRGPRDESSEGARFRVSVRSDGAWAPLASP